MADEMNRNVRPDSPVIRILADQVSGKNIDTAQTDKASELMQVIANDEDVARAGKQLAQVMTYTLDTLQTNALNFIDEWTDHIQIGANDKAVFRVPTRGLHVEYHAKGGSTTQRSYVADKQFTMETGEISIRPAINIRDLRAGRINMPDLIREANRLFTNEKTAQVEAVLHSAITTYGDPYYAVSTGALNKATLDAQLMAFKRLGNVSIIGDIAAISQVSALPGANLTSDAMKDEINNNGYLGRYNGASMFALTNDYKDFSNETFLATDWLYIILNSANRAARAIKVVERGGVYSMDSQNIDDMVYECRMDQEFGVAFVSGGRPALGAHFINA